MVPPLEVLAKQLREAGNDAVGGYYTLSTLAQLVQSLGHQAFGQASGILLVGDGRQHRDWIELALRGAFAPRQITLPPPEADGLLICGLGSANGFCLIAQPLADAPVEESAQLYEVVWSCSAPLVQQLIDGVGNGLLSSTDRKRLNELSSPPSAVLLQLANESLSFAARQHSTFAVGSRALNERLRNHEDQTRMIVHDMRAPLHTMLISIKALQRQRFDPDGQNELLEVARDSATYLLNLIETVLDSARLETSSWSLNLKPIRIGTLIQTVCEPLELAARPNQARLRRQVDEDLPVIRLDRALIERVLTNLVTNAIKHTPAEGEIIVSAKLLPERHTIELTVRDTGSGISPEALTRIFDRYYTGSGEQVRGTGLGLYFCRLAVEAHGGSINVMSVLGQGSTFTVRLPVLEG
jgi:signal transduction histidine kinase